jgi:hypothetical protein
MLRNASRNRSLFLAGAAITPTAGKSGRANKDDGPSRFTNRDGLPYYLYSLCGREAGSGVTLPSKNKNTEGAP